MNQQPKKFFVKHGNNEFNYYGSHMSMHMGSGSMLVYNEQGDVVGAHKEWDCAYEINANDTPIKMDKSNGINWFAVAAFCMLLFAAYHLYKTL